ncbi:hypothetical protein DL766_000363 [Monosporascus sp. MC13-8B]|uniref:DNA-directed RNA polymerase III subunit RPC3 n=1 Tax=Monosporascus cannonballus TaxID=155416 RepID=A0ABY0HH08_9PEZI|nr:hypothetical protein DL762_001673 [Monosporascus cannonballus]RYO99977.1 hypothetical protein DL763_001108 [Monosporascus cannonballus]RYP39541.1 hypothetical protein DL766_000363 [Monosporascus sp. MC13-8B]
MAQTKNVAELCVLLVSEIYGQLPSRIISALFIKGRSTTAQLAVHTALNQRQVRHGLAVLVQQNAVFHLSDPDSSITYYDANPDVVYNLVRSGKILEMVRENYGDIAKGLVQDVLVLGHIKMSDLVEAYKNKAPSGGNKPVNGVVKDEHDEDDDHGLNADGTHVNGVNGSSVNGFASEEDEKDPIAQAYFHLARLLAAGILEPVSSMMFQSPTDLKTAIEQEVLRNDFPAGIRGIKQKRELETAVAKKADEFQQSRTSLKRRLESEFDHEASVKRRRLLNGSAMSNGASGAGAVDLLMEHLDVAIRVNYDKCLVELRNSKLARYVEDLIGETTAQVYATLLTALGKKINRCQVDPMTKTEDDGDTFTGSSVNTIEIFEHLSPSIDVSTGIGIPAAGMIDQHCAEKIRRFPPKPKASILQSSLEAGDEIMGSDDEDYDRSDEVGFGANGFSGDFTQSKPGTNGVNGGEARSDDAGSVRAQRMRQMRQHLLLLAESKEGFIRHCGGNDRGEWTVDFEHLMGRLRLMELDILIEESFGRKGLRLVRVLREKGKLDDKMLPNIALMRKPDVHVKMAEMEMAGILDVQEVPRDNQRLASRTIFFWFFDEERTIKRTLDNTYKSMVRCLQRLEVERKKKRNVLAVTERKDVQGMEEEKLRGDVYNEYRQFLEIEKKLLGQVSKLDDLVAVFRDY